MSDDNTRRHWHGIPGDRHQHINVWMNGGAKSPSGRAAWAMPTTDTRRVGHLPLWISVSYISFPWHYITTITIPIPLYPSIDLSPYHLSTHTTSPNPI